MEQTEQKKSWLSSVFKPLVNLLDDAKDSIDRTFQINGYGDDSYMIDYTLRNAIHDYPEMDLQEAVESYLKEEGENDIILKDVMDYASTKDAAWFKELPTINGTKEDRANIERLDAKQESHNADMQRWNDLSDAVGGDMFDDPEKLAVMRKVDNETSGMGMEWDDFAEKVIAEIKAIPKQEPSPF